MKYYTLLIFFLSTGLFGQDIELFEQFNGNYDYLAFGNTMNTGENNTTPDCDILTSSDAQLNLAASETPIAAYLYWSGSGTGDLEVELNGEEITADETFSHTIFNPTRNFFAAFADVTNQIISEGNGIYTLSELDVSDVLDSNPAHCSSATNYAGWAIIVVYEDTALPLNQVNLFHGLQGVSIDNNMITINLDNLNVIDDEGAKIGFLAWEGDSQLAVDETLQVNGNSVGNPPLNPVNNAFNSTNSFTGDDDLYNMDLDVYDIENNIDIGDTSAEIVLTSGNGIQSSDFIMINNIVTVLNTMLPNPSPEINTVSTECNTNEIEVEYTIYNENSTDVLPAGTQVTFYANGQQIFQTTTENDIPIDGSETNQVTIPIPNNISQNFELQLTVNLDQNGETIINEIDETDNTHEIDVQLIVAKIATPPEDISQCDDNSNDGISEFDMTLNADLAKGNQQNVEIAFYRSEEDAENENDPIQNPEEFTNTETPQIIYIRVTSDVDEDCFTIDSFTVDVFYQPVISPLETIEICDDSTNDGIVTINLREADQYIIDNQPSVSVNYHLSEESAQNNNNPIENPEEYQNTETPETIYVRLENTEHPECFALTEFDIEVNAITTQPAEDIERCNEGFERAFFDLTQVEENLSLSSDDEIIGYYTTALNASNDQEVITTPTGYENTENPQQIFLRAEDRNQTECYRLYSFFVSVYNCPPVVPEGFSPSGDDINDTFEILGLYDIFEDFELKIYSRNGNLIYSGNNDTPAWDGTSNKGLGNQGNLVPAGIYYYVLHLNDTKYEDIVGWVYLNR